MSETTYDTSANFRQTIQESLTSFIKARTTTLLFINLAIMIVLSILAPQFLSPQNLSAVVTGMSYDVLMAIGMTLVLILGGIDLSVGSVLALAGVVTTMLISGKSGVGLPVPVAIVIGLGAASLCGAANGFAVARLKIAPFIVTLSMMTIARGLATVLTSGWFVADLPEIYLTIGQGTLLGIPYPVIFAVLITFVMYYLLRNWKPLQQIFYIGANPAAASLSGMPVVLATFSGYVLSSLLAGTAAIFMTSRLAMGFFQFGLFAELNAIAAAVIGGASFAGGRGNVFGTFLGVLMLAVIRNGFVLLKGSPNWQGVVSGAIVVVAIALDGYRRRHETRE